MLRGINLTQSSTEFKDVPPGTYLAKLTKHELKESNGPKTKGMPMVSWTFVVQEGEEEGNRCWLNTIINPDGKNNYSLFALCLASGAYTAEQLKEDVVDIDPNHLVGQNYVITVIHKDNPDGIKPFVNIKTIANGDTWTGPKNSSWE